MDDKLNIVEKIENSGLLPVKLLTLVILLLVSQYSLASSNINSKLTQDSQYTVLEIVDLESIDIGEFTPDILHSISEIEQQNVTQWTNQKIIVAYTDNLSKPYSIRAPPFIS